MAVLKLNNYVWSQERWGEEGGTLALIREGLILIQSCALERVCVNRVECTIDFFTWGSGY